MVVEKRRPGESYPRGFVKREIERMIWDSPQGIEEPELRENLRKKLNIRERKGIRKHLMEIERNGTICVERRKGKDNLWRPKLTIESVRKIGPRVMKLKGYRLLIQQIASNFESKVGHLSQDERNYLLTGLRYSPSVFELITSSADYKKISDYYKIKIATEADFIFGILSRDFPELYKDKRRFEKEWEEDLRHAFRSCWSWIFNHLIVGDLLSGKLMNPKKAKVELKRNEAGRAKKIIELVRKYGLIYSFYSE